MRVMLKKASSMGKAFFTGKGNILNCREDGRKFDGEFKFGKMDGYGIKYKANGKKEKTGTWFEGKFYKKGKHTTPK